MHNHEEDRYIRNAADSEVISASDDDVRRTVMYAIPHRVRVLDGPQEEVLASLVYPACPTKMINVGADGTKPQWKTGRRTVNDILKEVVDAV